jgi:hypothetical protein
MQMAVLRNSFSVARMTEQGVAFHDRHRAVELRKNACRKQTRYSSTQDHGMLADSHPTPRDAGVLHCHVHAGGRYTKD